jgi:hypothetical protein
MKEKVTQTTFGRIRRWLINPSFTGVMKRNKLLPYICHAMDLIKRFPIYLLFTFISIFLIDGGKGIVLVGNNVQIILNHHQDSDFEIPHQHSFNKYDDSEKLLNSELFDLSCSSNTILLSPYYLIESAEDYTGLVWQPPKSL